MPNLKEILEGVFKVIVGILFLLLFSFCMYMGSTMLGEKQVESQTKMHTNKEVTDSVVLDTITTVYDTVK